MATKITITIADSLEQELRVKKPKQIGFSEYIEDLIRKGLTKDE